MRRKKVANLTSPNFVRRFFKACNGLPSPGAVLAAGAVAFLVGCVSPARADWFRPSRKPSEHSVTFRSKDPKSFFRSLSYILEKQPADHVTTIDAKATIAELLFKTGNYRDAAQIFLQLTEAPLADLYKLSSFQYRLGECYFHMGLYGEAYDQFSRVRDQGHDSLEAEATLGMAMSALAQGNKSSSQAHLDLLLLENDYYKTYPRALYPLGIMLFQNEQYKRSLEFFERDPDDPVHLYFAGLAYRRLGQIPKALANFQKLTQRFAGTVWAERGAFEVAETYYQQGDNLLAAQSFQNWLKEFPNGTLSQESQFRLAATDIRKENYQAAVDRLEPLSRLDIRPSMEARLRHLLSEAWVQMGQVPELVNYIKKKGRARDRSTDDNFQLMWSLAALGRFDEALALSEEGLNQFYDPELTPKILLVQGFAHERVGRPAEALAAYQTVVDRFPRTAYAARALHLMAISYVRAQRWQELVTHVNHHWATLPEDVKRKHPEVEFWITEGQLNLENYALAQQRYQQFLRAAPNHDLAPYAYLGLAVAKAQNGQLEEGFQTLQQFASIAQQEGRGEWLALSTLQSANIYYNQKSYEKAIGYYRSFQTDFSTDSRVPQAHYQEGQALYRLEYYSDAVDAWSKMADKHPNHPLAEKARFQAARTLYDLGKTTAAVRAFSEFIAKHPNSPQTKEARLQLAHSYYNAGDFKRAIPKYQEFLALYPDADEVVAVQDFLQISYVQVGKTDAELEKLTQGQAKSQVLADLYWEKGAKAYNEKKFDEALGYFEKLMIEFPASSLAAQAAYYRGESLYLLERYEEASSAYRNFLSQYPNDEQASTAMFRLGVALFNLSRFDEAAMTFETFVERYPDDPLATNASENIALAYAKVGRSDEAGRAYQALLSRETDPVKRAPVLLQLAQVREREGKALEAIDLYEKVSSGVPEYAQAMYAVGEIYSRAGQVELEVKAYERLMSFQPADDPFRIAALGRLAELYISQGLAQKAVTVYEDVARNSGDQTALANAQARLEELKRVLDQ